MDWSNESYVRLYVRNTTTWRRLGFEGQTMLMHLLRIVDRAGVLDIEDMSPGEAASLHTGAPAEFAELGMSKLLELKALIHDGTRLVFPNFIEAQEATKSDRQRQKESRERRAVTNRDERSLIVTKSHELSQVVTSGHSLLCSAVPDLTDPPPARVGSDLIQSATGIFYGAQWRHELELIGMKPDAERVAVQAAISCDSWCKTNKTSVNPTHVLKHWARYAAGNPPMKSVARSRFAGPSRVPTAAEYAADKVEKAPWET